MDKLKQAGLFGDGLVKINGSLVKRYNGCLALLGVSASKLSTFSIDANGWSPEIAEEKDNNFYLNIGEANANAIIISPQQEGKPVFMPYHSFDRNLMDAVFAAYRKQIKDITKDSAIVVQLDQNIDAYYEAFDLLNYNKIAISFQLLGDLQEKQKEQNDLIKLFEEGNNFINREIHQKLIDSANKYGDLRHRKLKLTDLSLAITSFYTKAFGGVFVLRDFIKPILVFESKETFNQAIKNTTYDVLLFHIEHEELLATLKRDIITEINYLKAAKTARYERIKKHLFSTYLSKTAHSICDILNSKLLFKKYLNELPVAAQKQIMCVEIYNQKKAVENNLVPENMIEPFYIKALQEPHSSLQPENQEIIWQLLTKVMPADPVHLYWYDKEKFYKQFALWDDSYKDWAIDCILEELKNETP
ncbi:hypothetical protein K8089_07290 [Aequorivita sp. F47161]|uniref:Uncharacterized protein n=1 Tax=Aequorivita vitellina TaxID=2874475 RepID=A0A9X1QWU1_9FLAO|nr:DUF6638 family protein [Aequorivita vitellina]MCG2418822.1 hypothetical protein [Aequorivita vitellina]